MRFYPRNKARRLWSRACMDAVDPTEFGRDHDAHSTTDLDRRGRNRSSLVLPRVRRLRHLRSDFEVRLYHDQQELFTWVFPKVLRDGTCSDARRDPPSADA